MSEEEVFTVSPEKDLIERTWKKLESNLHKEGFREGALKGQEESYQAGFDLGFAEGFRLGEVLGFYKGSSSLNKHLNIDKPDSVEKRLFDDNERERACILCQSDNLLSKDVKDILTEQKKVNDEIISHFTDGK